MLAVSCVKKVSRQLAAKARRGATRDDVTYQLYVRQKIEAGLEAIERGQVVSHEDVKKRMAARG
jgi:predicted transcriptional regulator